jgi:hypothetical protein
MTTLRSGLAAAAVCSMALPLNAQTSSQTSPPRPTPASAETLVHAAHAAAAPDTAMDEDPGPPFVPSGKVWGYIFGDYFYKVQGDTASWSTSQYGNTREGLHAGQLRRLYFGYDFALAPQFNSRVLLEANDRTTFAAGSYGVFIKLGYLEWANPIKALPFTARVGLIPTPVFATPERTWGYRSVEKEALDARGFGLSTDQGISLQGTVGASKSYGYSLMVGNNSGTKVAVESDKAFYGAVYGRFLERKLTIEPMLTSMPAGQGRTNIIGRVFMGYETKPLRFGAEVAARRDGGRLQLADGSGQDVTRLLVSTFAAAPLPFVAPGLQAFARYDHYNPDTDFAETRPYGNTSAFAYTEHFFSVGINYNPADRVHIMPNLWMNTYSDRRVAAQDRKADIVPRLTLYYVF